MKKEGYKKYLKYSSLGFELVGFVLFGYFIGHWIDQKLATSKPYFTGLLILVLLAGAFYRLIKQLERDDKNRHDTE